MTTENIGVGINYLANLLSENTNLIRIFRVYHPVYRMHVNIDVEYHDPSYHIIERYMDMLICGYSQGDRFPEKNERKHYVRNCIKYWVCRGERRRLQMNTSGICMRAGISGWSTLSWGDIWKGQPLHSNRSG